MVAANAIADALRVLDMSDPTLVEFDQGLSTKANHFIWGTGNGIDVEIDGSGFTYSGGGSTLQLASGTISEISIYFFFGPDLKLVQLDITDTGALSAGGINKDDARFFWNQVLKGDDSFSLSGLAESQVGFGHNVIFGDDFDSATSSFAGITDRGGNDTILAADNEFDLYGDALTVEGKSTSFNGIPIINRAEYVAGDDFIFSATTDRLVKIVGDAGLVEGLATLHGGNDFLDDSKCSAAGALTVGDVLDQEAGTVNAGNDTISTAVAGTGIGDVATLNGGVLNAGADDIKGSAGADLLSGDVYQLSVSATLAGGNDTITGGPGNDSIYGEFAFVPAGGSTGVSSGNDVLKGAPATINSLARPATTCSSAAPVPICWRAAAGTTPPKAMPAPTASTQAVAMTRPVAAAATILSPVSAAMISSTAMVATTI